MMVEIRKTEESDFDDIWEIFHQVVERGETYAYNPETTDECFIANSLKSEIVVEAG